MKIGEFSKIRNHFDDDQEFPDNLNKLVNGYERAAKTAAHQARFAAKFGGNCVFTAQWYEGVAQTMEAFLEALIEDDLEFNMPIPPNFSSDD